MNNYNSEMLMTMAPSEFEHLIKTLLIKMGFQAGTTKTTGDGGIDIIATNEQPIISGKYIVQCKRYAMGNNVGEPTIRELYGVMHSENANKGILFTTSDFTRQSMAFGKDKAIELINGVQLLDLLNAHLCYGDVSIKNCWQQNAMERATAQVSYFQREVANLLTKEKIRSTRKKPKDFDEYDSCFTGELIPEFTNLREYCEPFLFEIMRRAFDAAKSEGNESDEKQFLNAFQVLFGQIRNDPDNGAYFQLIDDYYGRSLRLYKKILSIDPPYDNDSGRYPVITGDTDEYNANLKTFHDFVITYSEIYIKLFAAAREYIKTNNDLFCPLIINNTTAILEFDSQSMLPSLYRNIHSKFYADLNAMESLLSEMQTMLQNQVCSICHENLLACKCKDPI